MSNALSKGKKKKMQPLGYSMNEILGIQQYAKVQNNTNYLIEQSFENIKIIAYQILHDKFGFGNKRIVRVENTINAYLNANADKDSHLTTAELEYFMKSKCSISVTDEANKVPFRERFALVDKKVAPNSMQKAGQYLLASICNYFSLLGNCLKTQFRFSTRQIREAFDWIRYYINSLSGKYLDMTDVASVLYHECNYCDKRFIGRFREI